MPGFDEHHLDATVADLERAAGQRAEHPSWLAGLIAKHGTPLILRCEHDNGSRTEYAWPHLHLAVRIGEDYGDHYVTATNGNLSCELGHDRPPTDAEISAVVALAGLCDDPDRGTS